MPKVVITGECHTRGCASEVRQLLYNDFEGLSFVNPGSGIKLIKDTARMNIQQLTKEAVVVLWGGSNNVLRKNSIEGMKYILDFVRNLNHTNVILISVSHRHDLIRNSCVNNAVEAFNRKLWNRMKSFKKVEMINEGIERDFYMTHGQHLNTTGT